MNAQQPLVVGFDLDTSLIDTGPGLPATAHTTGHTAHPTALAGARDALAAVHRHGGSTVVVTATLASDAAHQVDSLIPEIDYLMGGVRVERKAAVLREQSASIHVVGHVRDVDGARGVLVQTDVCAADRLPGAGSDIVLDDLTEFPAWLDGHLLERRLAALDQDLRARGSVMVAFSGGADSAFLLAAAVRALGAENVAAATAYSDSLPQSERDPALELARALGVRVFTPRTREMEREGYRANAGDRCYFCKAELLDVLGPLADEHGFAHVATGTNADDAIAGFRPGIRAAHERGAVTPLCDAGLTKRQVRAASRQWDLPTWDKPAAACLSSRVAFGIEVSPFRLTRVERAEVAVRSALDLAGIDVRNLRVRDLGDRARIEIDAGLVAAASASPTITGAAIGAGFDAAEIDPRGFRSGAMNELLPEPETYRR